MSSSKACSHCAALKDVSCFFKNKSRKDGYDNYCKDCRREAKKKYYDNNSHSINKKHYQWFKSLSDERKEKYSSAARKRSGLYKEKALKRQKFYGPKRNAREAERRFRQSHATPSWLTEDQRLEIENLYWLARDLKSVSGQDYHVDHIVPLKHESVCGLHVPWNLQVLPSDINISKSNRMEKLK